MPALKRKGKVESFEDYGGTLSFNRDGKNNIRERDANDFASRLLMPQKTIFAKLDEILENAEPHQQTVDYVVPKIAKMFKVSKQAMTIRLIKLEIISA